jgi:hypothetical protein
VSGACVLVLDENIREAGRRAQRGDCALKTCPYYHGTRSWRLWRAGWREEQADSFKHGPIRHTRPMWLALDSKGRIQATWYRGCVQPWRKWRKVVKSLGWRHIQVKVVFPW